MQLKKDIWRPFLVHADMRTVLERGSLGGVRWTALPGARSLAYTADPFGLWRDNRLHVFVEAFDYRDAHGRIACHVFDHRFELIETRTVLAEPWHLSYPIVFEADNATWMLPEACGSGTLTLYRAREFPFAWEPHCRIDLDAVPIDATPVHWQGRWWLFYAPAGTPVERLTHLHAATADSLDGPWHPEPGNPIWVDGNGARPGGTPLVAGDALMLPVQDCRHSYGSGLRVLEIRREEAPESGSPQRLVVTSGPMWSAPRAAGIYRDGLHTMSSAGPVTLVDVKFRRFSLKGLMMRPLRECARLARRLRA